MKRILAAFVLLLLSIGMAAAVCFDNDEGKVFTVKGKVTLDPETEPRAFTDYCLSSRTLVEMFCTQDQLDSARVQCDCRGGACRGEIREVVNDAPEKKATPAHVLPADSLSVTFTSNPGVYANDGLIGALRKGVLGEPQVATKYRTVNQINKETDVTQYQISGVDLDEGSYQYTVKFKSASTVPSAREKFMRNAYVKSVE